MQKLLLNETLKVAPSYKCLHPLGSDTHILYLHYPPPTHMCVSTRTAHVISRHTFPCVCFYKNAPSMSL